MNTAVGILADIFLYGGQGLLFYHLLTGTLVTNETLKQKCIKSAIIVLPYFTLRMVVTRSTWAQKLLYGEQLYIVDSKDSIVSVLCSFMVLLCVAMAVFQKQKGQVLYLTIVYMAISEMVQFAVYCTVIWLPEVAFSFINDKFLEQEIITVEQYDTIIHVVQEIWSVLFFGLYLAGMVLVIKVYRRYLLCADKVPQGQELIYLTIPAAASLCFSILLRSILLSVQNGKVYLYRYLDGMERRISEFSISYATGNTITDVIVTRFFREAQQKEIQLECCFTFPKESSIDPFDMSIILNNGWNNAVEACEKLKKKERWILVKGIQKESIFFLEIKNTMSGSLLWKKGEDFPGSRKQEAKTHGMGMKNMENTIKKYQGHMEWQQEGQVFRVTIMLPLRYG